MKQLLRELKTLLLETKINLSELQEEQRSMTDKKTEWGIYQDLKKLDEITCEDEIDKKKVTKSPPPTTN
tara:strand:- start:292 stop:498 length:207 start_codon:yes stop_codon:yes gene_type:complete